VLVVLGIGGSALGNIALQSALNPYTYNLISDRTRTGPQLFVLDNVDPDQIKSVVDLITPKIKKTIVNVSASPARRRDGRRSFLLVPRSPATELGKKYRTTSSPRPIPRAAPSARSPRTRSIARWKSRRRRRAVQRAVGGRAVQRRHVRDRHRSADGGAAAMDKRSEGRRRLANPAALIAAIHYALDQQGKKISVMMPYATSLYYLGDWFRQLWAESLGKKDGLTKKNVYVGQTPVKGAGHDRSALAGAALPRGPERQDHHVPGGRAFQRRSWRSPRTCRTRRRSSTSPTRTSRR
jgi:glucose-6-phosphate isomerase